MVDTRKIAKELRLSHWAGIIRERKHSGLSVIEWCKNNDISQKTYYYWQRKVREAMCGELLAQQSSESAVADVPPSQTWAVCEVAPANEGKTLPIEINGCRVLASADTDAELLARTCKVLISLC